MLLPCAASHGEQQTHALGRAESLLARGWLLPIAVPVLWRVQGSYLYPDKSLYTGGWKAGKKHGQGEAALLG